MPSARIELTFQASEACVLSITLQGQRLIYYTNRRERIQVNILVLII